MTRSIFALLCVWVTSFSTLLALECPFDVAISGGWRRDDLKTLEIEPSMPRDFVNTHIDANQMDVWQYGIKARSTLAGMLFYQEGFALEHVYLRGSAYQGWIKTGHLHNFELLQSGSSSSGKLAFIHDGRTLDADIAVGVTLLPADCWITLAPVGGYSFNKQKVVVHPTKRERITYTTKWKGPFAGVDLAFDFCYFRLRAGYEYHWGYWSNDTEFKHRRRGHCSSSSSSSSGSSGSSSSSSSSSCSGFGKPGSPLFHAIGQVGFCDLRFYVCDGFDIGIAVKYQFWKTRKSKNQFSDLHVFGRASWHSTGVMGELVYRF